MNFFNIERVKAITAEQRALLDQAQEEETTPLSEQDQAILDAVNNGRWGCQDSSVRALVKAITGVDCPPRTRNDRRKPPLEGSMVILEGEPVVITRIDGDGDASFIRSNGTSYTDSYNYVSPYYDWRPATDEQIDQFFA